MHTPLLSSDPSLRNSTAAVREKFLSIHLSLIVGFLMLAGKWYAYLITGSAAILSDATESIVHVIAVSFAAYSMWLSHKPPDQSHPYGHEKISFFSAGVEGGMIAIASIAIIYEALRKWLDGLAMENIGTGILFVAGAAVINGVLGAYLVWQGKRHGSLILVANGKHVLTDFWTSLGVIVGLLLVMATGWLPFDPLIAIAVALNILWSGGRLLRQSVGGLMDEGDPELENRIRKILDNEARARGLAFHEVRYRNAGTSVWIEFHLLFPRETSLEEAHWKATEIESAIKEALGVPVNITSHLEPAKTHDKVHEQAGPSLHL